MTPSPYADRSAAAELVKTILSEGAIGMAQAAKLYGPSRGGRPTHASTLTRHATLGVRLADGTVVRLEAVRVGGRLVTSAAAVVRFITAQQGPAPAGGMPAPRGPAARLRASEAAARQLEELGA